MTDASNEIVQKLTDRMDATWDGFVFGIVLGSVGSLAFVAVWSWIS